MLKRLALAADRIGLRKLVAAALNLTRPGQRFAVDGAGRWLNIQHAGTLVSPDLHTGRLSLIREWVLDHWCMTYTPSQGDVIVDVGSGIGEEALILSAIVGETGRIVAVEAHPGTFGCLEETVRLSGLTNVHPVHAAVGDREGTAMIGDGGQHLANSILTGGETPVEMITLDRLLEPFEHIDFVRINIEGAETLALRGMTSRLAKVRHLCVSCHDFCGFETKAAVIAWLETHGFAVTLREPEPDRPWIGDYVYAARVDPRTA